jgi:hypothetical protein
VESWADKQLADLRETYGCWDIWYVALAPRQGYSWHARPVGTQTATVHAETPEELVAAIGKQGRSEAWPTQARQGRREPQAPLDPPGKAVQAQQQRYGICWQADYQTQNGATWAYLIDISAPEVEDGVHQCSQGETFVSIVPEPATTP